jgi:hypothetical protein
MTTGSNMRMGKVALGLSLGTVWGLSMLVMGLLANFCGYGAEFVSAIGTMYIGYNATVLGSLIGALWGFVDMFTFGFLVAFLYNCFSGCCCPMKSKDKN